MTALKTCAVILYYDIENSPKAAKLFVEIQRLLNTGFNPKNAAQAKQLIRPISSRFLQMLDVTNRVSELFDALWVYYYSFLSNEEQVKYRYGLNGTCTIMLKIIVLTTAVARMLEAEK